jgi:pimeloyl-ACP methyl ester carboxylesterase
MSPFPATGYSVRDGATSASQHEPELSMKMPALLLSLAFAAPAMAQTEPTTAAPFVVERSGTGRAMILIPGLLSSGDVWKGTVERFASRYDMHVLTLAGFAGAPPTGADPFLATTRDAVIRYIREQKLDRPILVGHSLGGFLALWVAATAPDLAGPVIAVDGVPFLPALLDTTMTPERSAPQATAIRSVFAGMSSETLGAQTRVAMSQQVRDTAWHNIGARWGTASDAKTAGRAIEEMMTTDLRPDVARITSPVLLFMAGDGMTADIRAQMLQRYQRQLDGVKDARVVAAERARHFIMLDDASFFHATMTSFLAGR